MGVIQTGLVSKYDWAGLIDALIAVKRRPIDRLEDRVSAHQSELTTWQNVNTKLLGLKSTSESLDTYTDFLVKSASSSDTDILTVSASSQAQEGSHTVEVAQLASAEKEIHGGMAGYDSVVTSGVGDKQFDYSVGGGATISVTVPDGTTLEGLMDLINNDVDNDDVTASVLNDGSESGTDYHLVLTGNETGSEEYIDIEATTTLNGDPGTVDFQSGTWTQTQAASDSWIKVDGYAPPSPSGYIERETNTISDVLDGVTLTLHATSGGSTEDVTISNDLTGTKANIQLFVDSYNEVLSTIDMATSYSADTDIAGPLQGDYAVYDIRQTLQYIISSAIPGVDSNNFYDNLSQVGITTGAGGALTINSTKLDDALEDNFDDVGKLFTEDWGSDNNAISYFTRSTDTQGGNYAVAANFVGGVLDSGTIGGWNAAVDGNYLIGAEGTAVVGLRLQCTFAGSATENANVHIGLGVAAQSVNSLTYITDEYEGPVAWAEDRLNESIADLRVQIVEMEMRLVLVEDGYMRKFNNLELYISQINTQTSFMSSYLGS